MTTTRLIERWLPIADIGEESARERRSMTALPGIYFLHVWWARRPLVASRAAVLASLLPADANREDFKYALGIHGNPAHTKLQIEVAKKTKRNLGPNPYGYKRAFQFHPNESAKSLLPDIAEYKVLDPTAGGGAIPLEAMRLGAQAHANDLNPVASLIIRATAELPARFGSAILSEYDDLVSKFSELTKKKLVDVYPDEEGGRQVDGYLWARTFNCPYCAGRIPMSPSWGINTSGVGVRLDASVGTGHGDPARRCYFEIVETEEMQSAGTVAKGDAICPFEDCGRTVDGDEIKRQAQDVGLGDQLYAVVYREKVARLTPSGKKTTSWIRKYRAPDTRDEDMSTTNDSLDAKLNEWNALGTIPDESFPEGTNDDRPRIYGMPLWRDLFSPRCLIPRFDGAILSLEWKEAIWDRYVTGAPRPRTPSEQQYSDRKLRSRR